MRKALVLIVMLGLLGGCASTTLQPLRSQILAPPPEWVAAYGDSDFSCLCYNLAVLRVVLNQHAEIMNNATTQPATQPVE